MVLRVKSGVWRRAWLLMVVAGVWAVPRVGVAQAGVVMGVVVDDVTGQPMGRALVSSTDGRMAEMTNAEGQFRLEVGTGEEGGMEVRARRPGYLAMEHGVKVAAGATRVELRLRPEAVVTGRVETGDGVLGRGLRVTVEERRIEDGRAMWEERGGGTADFEGEYRVAGLAPGEYRVETREWVEPGTAQPGGVPEVGYPPVRMEAMRVGEGQRVEADVRLRAERYFPVEVPVANCGEDGIGVETRSAAGLELALGADEGVIKGALPKGSYVLRVSCFGAESRVGEVDVVVGDGPVRTGPVSIAAGAVVPVEVREAFTNGGSAGADAGMNAGGPGPHPGGSGGGGRFGGGRRMAEVMLQPVDGMARLGDVGRMRTGPQGGSELVGVGPGRYWVHVMPRQGYVASATAGGVDLRREPLVVGSGGGVVPMAVELRDDTGSVSGSAAAGVAQVRLLPVENGMARERDAAVGADGTFSVSGLVPGRWLVLGSGAELVPIEFRRVEVERGWESRGAVVEVTAGGKATATVAGVARAAAGEGVGQ